MQNVCGVALCALATVGMDVSKVGRNLVTTRVVEGEHCPVANRIGEYTAEDRNIRRINSI